MPSTNYLNNLSEEPVIVRISNMARPIHHDTVAAGTHSGLTQGKFVGLNSSGNVVNADASAAVKIPAIGVLAYSAQHPWLYESKSGNKNYNELDMYEEYLTFKCHSDLTFNIGQPIWLSSGGGITQNYPNVTNNLRQQVAWAVSESEYAIRIFDAETIGW